MRGVSLAPAPMRLLNCESQLTGLCLQLLPRPTCNPVERPAKSPTAPCASAGALVVVGRGRAGARPSGGSGIGAAHALRPVVHAVLLAQAVEQLPPAAFDELVVSRPAGPPGQELAQR